MQDDERIRLGEPLVFAILRTAQKRDYCATKMYTKSIGYGYRTQKSHILKAMCAEWLPSDPSADGKNRPSYRKVDR